MAEPTAQDTTPTDTIGKRLTVIGAISLLVVGVIWFGQKNSHDGGQDILSAVRDPAPFNSTPYLIAAAIAAAVLVLGLVLRKT